MTFSTLASPGVSLQGGGGSGGGGGTPGGSDTQVQFNDGGAFGGDSGLTFNKTSKAITLGGATVTTSSPVIDAAQTWNDGAVTFTGLKFNATNTASAAASLLMDLQVGGTSAFNVSKAGSLKLGINSSGTNVAGTNVVVAGSQGTGTGAGGSIIFQVAPAGLAGTNVNALATALTIDSTRKATFAAGADFAAAVQGATNIGATNNLFAGAAFNNAAVLLGSSYGGISQVSTGQIGWTSSTTDPSGARDLILARDAANTLAQRNGGTSGTPVPQAFRVYNWFDGTNGEYLENVWGGNVAYVQTEKTGAGTRRKLYISGVGIRLDPTPASSGTVEILAANISTDTTTGMKIGTATTQKLGFWNATPIVQPTTGVAAATVAATGIGDVVAASTTFDGYTVPQIVKAMRNAGLLA